MVETGQSLRMGILSLADISGATAAFLSITEGSTRMQASEAIQLVSVPSNKSQEVVDSALSGNSVQSTPLASDDSTYNAPLFRRRLPAAAPSPLTPRCKPVNLTALAALGASLKAPVSTAQLSITLPRAYFAARNATTTAAMARVAAAARAELVARLAAAVSLQAAISEFAAKWAACTGWAGTGIVAAISSVSVAMQQQPVTTVDLTPAIAGVIGGSLFAALLVAGLMAWQLNARARMARRRLGGASMPLPGALSLKTPITPAGSGSGGAPPPDALAGQTGSIYYAPALGVSAGTAPTVAVTPPLCEPADGVAPAPGLQIAPGEEATLVSDINSTSGHAPLAGAASAPLSGDFKLATAVCEL